MLAFLVWLWNLLSIEFLRQANKENDEVYTHVTLLPQPEVWFLIDIEGTSSWLSN